MPKDSDFHLQNKSEQTLEPELSPLELAEIAKNDPLAILASLPKGHKLASSWKRLIAKTLDLAVFMLASSLFFIIGATTLINNYPEAKLEQIEQSCTTVESMDSLLVCQEFVPKVSDLLFQSVVFGLILLALYFILWPQSLGKKLLKIEVLSQDNQKITQLQHIAREILTLALALVLTLGLFDFQVSEIANFIWVTMVFSSGQVLLTKYAFHDQIAKTKVVDKN